MNNLPISETIIKGKAINFAQELQVKEFHASNVWFEIWRGRLNVSFKAIAEEEKVVTTEMASLWWETHLPTILSQFELKDICNIDEFGLSYQALPTKTMKLKAKKFVGGKSKN